jgi:hypothetical protein
MAWSDTAVSAAAAAAAVQNAPSVITAPVSSSAELARLTNMPWLLAEFSI